MFDLFFWLPFLILMTSLLAGVITFFLSNESEGLRSFINLSSAVLKIVFVGILMTGVYQGHVYEFRFPLFLKFDIVLHADAMSVLFVSLSSVLWLLTTIYAIGYFRKTPDQSRFFGFFSLCVCATTAIAMSGNLFTFLVFYELLTVTTYPLIVHRGDKAALSAGRVYLGYTLLGGAVLLLAMVWLSSLSGSVDFVERGTFAGMDAKYYPQLVVIFFMLILGFGIKAAMVPLHGWLPVAMIAPAPVSALLHAVAVVKAGAFGIVRTVYDIYGIEFCREQGLLNVLIVVACVTIIYGSLRALSQDSLKRRLAFSTVSQVSYIVLGVATLSATASTGGIVHLIHQGIMKITLFMCAGNLAREMNVSKISEMNGVARRMPLTMGAFTVGALGMIGIPPMAGFVSKWYLGIGALEANQPWVLVVLLASSLLNAAYFLPIIYAAWFKEPETEKAKQIFPWLKEARLSLLFPPLITAGLTLLMGVFAGAPFSPLTWAKLITFREYGF